MGKILIIDTALENAHIIICEKNKILHLEKNDKPLTYSSWLHNAIQNVTIASGITLQEIAAIAVTIGPGSYTGLRIGVSAAKGLCFVLGCPLITLPTLELIAIANVISNIDLYMPMIDARRNDVFTATYSNKLDLIQPAHCATLKVDTYIDKLEKNRILFCGMAATKLQSIMQHTNASFCLKNYSAKAIADLSINKLIEQKFVDVNYVNPLYAKEFHFL